jgi:methionine biosynthesis protein MetW
MKDNRKYNYSENSLSQRNEYPLIISLIKNGSKVIDLASGDGSLLKLLKEKKGIEGFGVEISPSGVKAARKNGVKSVVGRVDIKLPYKDKEFDYAVCNVTLQMVMYPEVLLKEMCRISKRQIVSIPNFAYAMNRFEMLFKGKMPEFMLGGYKWFSTGMIHQLSLDDFADFCKKNKIKIVKTKFIFPDRLFILPRFILKFFPNLFAGEAVFLTSEMKKPSPSNRGW